ncbi:MAG: hypothetical protein P8Q45_02025 [Candidatus Thalassarchaeaceae archaeon]|nr:hypothetical protein [Candidatus Thalassarchaeaceae archaeon]
MRRKQTAFFVTLLILSSLVFVSQTRPQAPVSSVDPPDQPGSGPMAVDQDEDLIPDIHEVIFGEARHIDTPFGIIVIDGLDPMNGSDNITDFDRDGASALMEYCWPWTLDTCFTERLSLTGKSPDETESGFREYLDPRESDSDGDGIPDGFEIYMCTEGGTGYQNQATSEWVCLYFDPLDSSDLVEDADLCIEQASQWGCGDGFDINRDGEIDIGERYTNSEEYWFGAPDGWLTERDGLWCAGKMPNLHADACQTDIERPTGDDGWLGTDPRRIDSDHYTWSELVPTSLAVPGDGIPDGWEAYHGLDPRNASDAVLDSDSDGWDIDRDGFIIPDTSIATAQWGEAFSNFEEYMLHLDSGNWVRPGLRASMLTGASEESMFFDQSTDPMLVDGRVHTVISDQGRDRLIVGSAYGITTIDPFQGTSSTAELPQGMEMFTMMRWSPASEDYLIIGTNQGLHALILENGLPQMDTMTESDIGAVRVIERLQTGSGDLDLFILGQGTNVWTMTLSEPASGRGTPDFTSPIFIQPLSDLVADAGASLTEVIHVPMAGRGPMLIVGTDSGMIRWDTTDGTPSIGNPFWIYDTDTAEDYVQFADLLNSSKSAVVNVMELAGPVAADGSLEEVTGIWLGTPGGLHLIDLDLFVGLPEQAFNTDRMFNIERWEEGANDIHSILAIEKCVILGSRDGTWALEGGSHGILGYFGNQTRLPGLVTSLSTFINDGNEYIFAGVSPGKYMNIMPIDPQSSDSDLDGMPDGWEFVYGLDPTDPYDRERDADADGVHFDVAGVEFSRDWSNLDEYRFVNTSEGGFNGTDPRNIDTDGDGLTDGQEYWGWFADSTEFSCHYLNEEYICDDDDGEDALDVHLSGWLNSGAGGGTDGPTDPTSADSDGDGMPDGWEIEHRRWIGDVYTGGNLWTLDPRDPSDATMDADGDGLDNLCEYMWGNLLETVLIEGLPTHRENASAAQSWTKTDPNNPDSDGDSLPDGWEARYQCTWGRNNQGINPLNGSDALNNPDGDGFDVNHDGVLDLNESLVNWLEYHLKDQIIHTDTTDTGLTFPDNFTTLLAHESWIGFAGASFGLHTSNSYRSLINGTTSDDVGASNPLESDSDHDGIPDGWEFYHARWSLYDEGWTLNPVDEGDQIGDPDGDGMNNWEEYNVIDGNMSEIDDLTTVPQFYLLHVGGELLATPWLSAESTLSFGTFLSEEQISLTGYTADPNDPDTDGDGLLDGIELMFTRWNASDEVWTLNPLVAGDGNYDSDRDGITDLVELNLTNKNPQNGGLSPPDAPRLWEEAESLDPDESVNRVYRILFNKEGRAEIALEQFDAWQLGEPAKPLLQALLGITDPNAEDTDRDGMSDGYEYWFTEWDLEANIWTMNALTDADVHVDSDEDSFDCNGDGYISDSESFDNLAEYDARVYGKRSAIDTIPNGTGLVSYGLDTITAFMQEQSMSEQAAADQLWVMFSTKDIVSSDRAGLINSIDPDNFNFSLAGVSDPTHADSDSDGLPDGWEFCYSIYGQWLPVNEYRWSLNPLNPLDIEYDPDADGWYDRTIFDTPATQGEWENREFTPGPAGDQIIPSYAELYFTNLMEYNNGTHPLDIDSDDDSQIMEVTRSGGNVVSYEQNMNLSDGREVFKYGTNALDNDTDGDMMPDFYEYYRGWNETNDNWSSHLQISVVWYQVTPSVLKPVTVNGGTIGRPLLDWTWFTHDATDASDAGQDADNDGGWDCTGGNCVYIPYNNFQEYYGVVNATLSSPTLVRQANLFDCSGGTVEEWWQLREALLGTCGGAAALETNYFRMYKINNDDTLYAYIVDDNDVDYQLLDESDDEILVNGAWADIYDRFAGDRYHFPNTGLGEYVWGWWMIDIDGDQIADGTNPAHWDTDGDWLNDYFEIEDDMLDGVRGNSGSPIRYDDRTTE